VVFCFQLIVVMVTILYGCLVYPPQHIPNLIVDIKTYGHRIYVSDVQESIHFLRYRPVENQLIIFADDTFQRSCNLLGFE